MSPGKSLSIARLRQLPAGAVIVDRHGNPWVREVDRRTGRPGWFRSVDGFVASYTTLHEQHRPLRLRTR